jgi:hypothetical protein
VDGPLNRRLAEPEPKRKHTALKIRLLVKLGKE